uniref:Uncharacterized protein n=1 Tax=Oryza sativa subsp. japonica TaxID=39947 RepID=Q84R86_ORYSJ|nr:hypothetical protein [Oryza sativa Japonica Group]
MRTWLPPTPPPLPPLFPQNRHRIDPHEPTPLPHSGQPIPPLPGSIPPFQGYKKHPRGSLSHFPIHPELTTPPNHLPTMLPLAAARHRRYSRRGAVPPPQPASTCLAVPWPPLCVPIPSPEHHYHHHTRAASPLPPPAAPRRRPSRQRATRQPPPASPLQGQARPPPHSTHSSPEPPPPPQAQGHHRFCRLRPPFGSTPDHLSPHNRLPQCRCALLCPDRCSKPPETHRRSIPFRVRQWLLKLHHVALPRGLPSLFLATGRLPIAFSPLHELGEHPSLSLYLSFAGHLATRRRRRVAAATLRARAAAGCARQSAAASPCRTTPPLPHMRRRRPRVPPLPAPSPAVAAGGRVPPPRLRSAGPVSAAPVPQPAASPSAARLAWPIWAVQPVDRRWTVLVVPVHGGPPPCLADVWVPLAGAAPPP